MSPIGYSEDEEFDKLPPPRSPYYVDVAPPKRDTTGSPFKVNWEARARYCLLRLYQMADAKHEEEFYTRPDPPRSTVDYWNAANYYSADWEKAKFRVMAMPTDTDHQIIGTTFGWKPQEHWDVTITPGIGFRYSAVDGGETMLTGVFRTFSGVRRDYALNPPITVRAGEKVTYSVNQVDISSPTGVPRATYKFDHDDDRSFRGTARVPATVDTVTPYVICGPPA
jgi:hypothetical protein